MEVEEENTSIHLQESTTAVSNERFFEDRSLNDIELEIEVPESNTQEEQGEKSSGLSPKLDDPNHFDAVAAGETAEEKEVTDGCGSSEVVGPTSLLKDEKDGAEDVISTSVVAAAAERGGSELTNLIEADVGECEAAVIVRDSGSVLVAENVNKIEEDTNTNDIGSFVIEDDDDKMETVKVEDAGEALTEGGRVSVPLLPVAEIGEREEAMADVKSDGVELVVGNEAITESQGDVQVLDAEVVADEEEGHGIGKAVKEEGNMADEEKAADVTENVDDKPTVADEEKSLDTELETDEEATMADEEKVAESVVKGGRGKRKRGRKNSTATPKKIIDEDEDVCFICFDGGDLVLCDLRTCPKAYHPSCVNRDPAFFQTKGRWNCVNNREIHHRTCQQHRYHTIPCFTC